MKCQKWNHNIYLKFQFYLSENAVLSWPLLSVYLIGGTSLAVLLLKNILQQLPIQFVVIFASVVSLCLYVVIIIDKNVFFSCYLLCFDFFLYFIPSQSLLNFILIVFRNIEPNQGLSFGRMTMFFGSTLAYTNERNV